MRINFLQQFYQNKGYNSAKVWRTLHINFDWHIHVLFHQGTNQIEGILVDFPEGDPICIHPEVFVEMKRLRLFINRNAIFSGGPRHLPNNLRVLDWPEYPLLSLPSNFRGKKLCSFSMPNSLLKELGEGFKVQVLVSIVLSFNYVWNSFIVICFLVFDRISKT